MYASNKGDERPVSKASLAGGIVDRKDYTIRRELNAPTIADVYLRLNKAMEGNLILFSGASIHLISPQRKVGDIDVFVKESKLCPNDGVRKKLEAEGFEIVDVIQNRIHAIGDKKSGITVETTNGNIKSGDRVVDHRELCRLLGCKEDIDTLMGFHSGIIIGNAIGMLVTTDDGTAVEVKVPHPIHQIGIKYNLWRLRGGTKDIEDMNAVIKYHYGTYDSFVEKGGIERLKNIGEYLGTAFESRIIQLLRGGSDE
jgi:hypothetical protein